MKNLIATAVLGLLLLTMPAWAQMRLPLNKEISLQATICDTQDEVASILNVQRKDGFTAALVVFRQLNAQTNDKGEPVCGVIRGPVVIEAKVATFPDLDFNGRNRTVYVVRLKSDGDTYYAISFSDIADDSV